MPLARLAEDEDLPASFFSLVVWLVLLVYPGGTAKQYCTTTTISGRLTWGWRPLRWKKSGPRSTQVFARHWRLAAGGMAKKPPSPSGSTLPEGRSYFKAYPRGEGGTTRYPETYSVWGVWQGGNVKVYDEVSSRLLRDVVSGTAGIAWVSWTRGRLLGMRGLLPQPHEPFCKPVVDFQQVQPVGMGEVGKRFCERMQTVEVETVYTVYRRMFVWTSWSYSSGKVALGVVAGRALELDNIPAKVWYEQSRRRVP